MEGVKKNLKSNMDRFIVFFAFEQLTQHLYLKSNMDRFIVEIGRSVIVK